MQPASAPASLEELEAIRAQRDAADEARKEVESELEVLRERLAAIKADNEAVPDTHDWDEDKTRKLIIDLGLQSAGWQLDGAQDREYQLTGMPNNTGIGYADYVLWGDDGKPLAVVEAKKTTVDPEAGGLTGHRRSRGAELLSAPQAQTFRNSSSLASRSDVLAAPAVNATRST